MLKGWLLFKNQNQIEGQGGKKRKIPDFFDDILLKVWRPTVLRRTKEKIVYSVCVYESERERKVRERGECRNIVFNLKKR